MLDHYKGGAMPVASLPEIIQGKPLNLPTVVRWLLNKLGVLNEGCLHPRERYRFLS